MKGDPFRKVRPGETLRIPAAAWNAMLQVAARQQRAGGGVRPAQPSPQNTTVLVRNDSGAARGRFGILGIDDVAISPSANLAGFQNAPVLSGVTPAAGHVGRFAILTAPAPSEAIVPAVVGGVTAVQIDVTDTDHAHADIASGDPTKLESAEFGSATILWAETGTGTKWAVIRIGGLDESPWSPGMVMMWTGLVANIPSGWALCDGGEYCFEHGIKDHGHGSGYTTVDLSGRFVLCIDEDGQADENATGDTGGYRKHGTTENNHSTHGGHSLNAHTIPPHTILDHTLDDHHYDEVAAALEAHTKQEVVDCIENHNDHTHQVAIAAGSDIAAGTDYATDSDTNANIGGMLHDPAAAGSDLAHTGQSPNSLEHGISDHDGSFGHTGGGHTGSLTHAAHTDSDNRPRYYALAFIERIR